MSLKSNKKQVCVYASSSEKIDDFYKDQAFKLGALMAENDFTLVYGGGTLGLMGAVAKGVHSKGGEVIGIIPKALNIKGVVYEKCDTLIETKDLRERKGIMQEKSSAFIALPGGFGTLEEIAEMLTLKQIHLAKEAIVILNLKGFYNPLFELFKHFYKLNFAKDDMDKQYFITESLEQSLEYIKNFKPIKIGNKWD